MGYEKDSGEKESTTIQEKSWQDSSGNDGGTNNNPNNNGGFTDNSQSAKEALQLQKMAKSSSEYIQLKKWADNIGGDGDTTPNDYPIQKKENKTGLPDKLKTGMENNSGMPLDDVKVHRNSEKPAQLQAHAYAQGTDIHLGPGQEKHLPHELGHVVQQKQGIVKPTTQKNGAAINDDKGLEKNADTLGAKALQPTAQLKAKDTDSNNAISNLSQVIQQWQKEATDSNETIIQPKITPSIDVAQMLAYTQQEQVKEPSESSNILQLQEDTSPTAEEGAIKPEEAAQTDIDLVNESAIAGNASNNVIELTKEQFKEQLDGLNKDIVPPIEVQIVHNFVTPSGIPLYLQLKEKTEFKYGLDIGGTSEVVGASVKIGAFGVSEGSVGVGVGGGLPDKLLFGLGLSGKIELPIQIGPELKFTIDKGFEPGAVEFKAELNAKLMGDFTIFGQTYSVTLTGAKIAEVATQFNPGMGPLTFDWKFEPTEDSLFPADKLFQWFTSDDNAIEVLEGMTQQDIDLLPPHIKSGLLANINDIFVSDYDNAYMLKLLNIYQQPNSPFSQQAWTVLEQAYELAEGRKPTGFEELQEWLTSAGMETEINQSLSTNQEGQTEQLVDVQLRCNSATNGSEVEMWGFTEKITGVTTDLTEMEVQEIRNEINAKNRPVLQLGYNLSTGKRIRVSYHIEFIGGGSLDYWNNSYTLNERSGSKDAYFIEFISCETSI